MDLGYDAGSSGTYGLSGSGLLSATYEYIGYYGGTNNSQASDYRQLHAIGRNQFSVQSVPRIFYWRKRNL